MVQASWIAPTWTLDQFSGATSIDVGGDPYRGMSLADVTGDGPADLITPNPDHLAVLVAGEDGGFRPRASLPTPFGPFSVVAADLTGDGLQDAAAACGEGAGSLATWCGLADGSFRVGSPYGLAMDDRDGDGRLDFAVPNECPDSVSVS